MGLPKDYWEQPVTPRKALRTAYTPEHSTNVSHWKTWGTGNCFPQPCNAPYDILAKHEWVDDFCGAGFMEKDGAAHLWPHNNGNTP